MALMELTIAKVAILLCFYGIVDAKQCGNDTFEIYKSGLSPDDINTILELHNQKRQQVASGNCTSLSGALLPEACDMTKMEWDDTLAAWGQIHTDGCLFEHWNPAQYNQTSYYGQNLFIKYSSSKLMMEEPDWISAVHSWTNESEIFDSAHRMPYQFSHEAGHFTQVVWAKTHKVGCGATWFVDNTETFHPYRTLYTCQYWPGGNYLEQAIYATEQCDKCPLDATYPNLCVVQ